VNALDVRRAGERRDEDLLPAERRRELGPARADAGHLGVRGAVALLAAQGVARARRARVARREDDGRDARPARDVGLQVGRLEQEVVVRVGDDEDGAADAVEDLSERRRGLDGEEEEEGEGGAGGHGGGWTLALPDRGVQKWCRIGEWELQGERLGGQLRRSEGGEGRAEEQ